MTAPKTSPVSAHAASSFRWQYMRRKRQRSLRYFHAMRIFLAVIFIEASLC